MHSTIAHALFALAIVAGVGFVAWHIGQAGVAKILVKPVVEYPAVYTTDTCRKVKV